jgi:ABC-type branched-subunit amino acid transport system ATPase component
MGTGVLRRSGRYMPRDIERLDASVKADIEVRRDRVEGHGKLLMARGLEAGYDNVRVLFGVDFDVDDGEMVAVLGTNGAGKSTLVKALCGLVVPTGGEVLFDGQPITTLDPNRIVKLGIAMVPGDRGIFPGLTTADNLKMAGWLYDKDTAYIKQATKAVLGYFPAIQNRLSTPAGSLSGGEQQMLSLAMAFIAQPRLMIIDELSLGLAPTVIESLLLIVKAINERGTAVILVEQSVNLALRMCSRATFMEKGQVVFQGPTSELVEHEEIVRSVLLEGARHDAVAGTGLAAGQPRARVPEGANGASTLSSTSLGALHIEDARAAERSEHAGVVLSARGIVKRFGGVLAVDDVSLELNNGEILGLIGPNGAGKTTVFEIISGQLGVRPRAVVPGRPAVAGTDRPRDRLIGRGASGPLARDHHHHAVLTDGRPGREEGGGGGRRGHRHAGPGRLQGPARLGPVDRAAPVARAGGHRGPAAVGRPARRTVGRIGPGRDRGPGPGAP